jgi:hypothetical protein
MSKQSSFVPNSFQTPNAYVDEVMPYLTGEEFKVLTYAVRRILGFQKRQDRISISQFTDGTHSKDGGVLDKGTGLSIGTVKTCLKSLVDFGLMVRLDENDAKANEGVLWALQWDGSKVNWMALEDRYAKKQETGKKRISKARSVRQTHVTRQTPASGTEHPPVSPTDPPPASGTETQYTSETHGNTEVNINKASLDLFKSKFGKFYGERELYRWAIFCDSIGPERAQEIVDWAFKKEIHLANRAALLDSMETAARKWKTKPTKKQTVAQSGDYNKYKDGDYADFIK